jgi:predicted RNA-binding protein with PIN domain
MSRRVYVDAMNVIRTNPSLARVEDERGNIAARRELLRLCREYLAREGGSAEYTVVFDGGDSGLDDAEDSGSLVVICSGEKTADEIIIEKAEDARALGHEAWIVSNDAEVRAAGTHTIRSEDFYDDLIRRPTPREPESQDELAKRLVAHLVAAGHLPSNAASNSGLAADLARHLEYYSGAMPRQKLSKKLEAVFREHTRVEPDPDPQKSFHRELKAFFGKEKT